MNLTHTAACSGVTACSSRCHRPPLCSVVPCTPFGRHTRIHKHKLSANASNGRSSGRYVVRRDPYDSLNPDLDEIQLDDAYYEEIGMTREDAMRQQKEMLHNIDPDAMLLDDIGKVDESLPEEWRKAIESLEVYGPQV